MNVLQFLQKKQRNEKISLLTCYDAASSKLVEKTTLDCILVGDSVAMVVHGHANTTMATMPMMVMHTAAVARANKKQFIVADLPFLSYRRSLALTMENVFELIQAGAHAIKLEGAKGNLNTIQYIVESGIPVMGHIGLTPQAVHHLGGHKVQGKNEKAAEALIEEALQLEQAGCFAVVLECIPASLAKTISERLTIPTIGIGAGPDCDGQVLVWHDMLGFNSQFTPKFLKVYLDSEALVCGAIEAYISDVKTGEFPIAPLHTY